MPRRRTRPTPTTRSTALLVGCLVLQTACAARFRPADPAAAARALRAQSYSGDLKLSLAGPTLRARTAVLVGFRRPDTMRIEVPGPSGARLVAVARDGKLAAVFPAHQAYFEGDATAEVLEALFGVSLTPRQVMDALLGVGGPGLSDYRVDWGSAVPARIEARLDDGARLKLEVRSADIDPALPDAAFEAPAHSGFRRVLAEEARELWR